MPVTRADIMDELEIQLGYNVTVINPDPGDLTPDPNTGEITYPMMTDLAWNVYVKADTKLLLEALIDAILIRIDRDGLEMGESIADKMEVG